MQKQLILDTFGTSRYIYNVSCMIEEIIAFTWFLFTSNQVLSDTNKSKDLKPTKGKTLDRHIKRVWCLWWFESKAMPCSKDSFICHAWSKLTRLFIEFLFQYHVRLPYKHSFFIHNVFTKEKRNKGSYLCHTFLLTFLIYM